MQGSPTIARRWFGRVPTRRHDTRFVRRDVRIAYRTLLQLPDPAAPVQKLLDVERPGMRDGSADPHHPSANSTVDRYRSPESGSTVTIVLPANASSRASRSATAAARHTRCRKGCPPPWRVAAPSRRPPRPTRLDATDHGEVEVLRGEAGAD